MAGEVAEGGLWGLWASNACVFLLLLSFVLCIFDPNKTLGTDCSRVFLWPAVAMALFLFILLLVGCFGLIAKKFGIIFLYILGVFILVLTYIGFFIFGFVAVAGIQANGGDVSEYKLGDSNGWLARRVSHPRYWDKIMTCLRKKHACDGMTLLVREPKTALMVPAFHGGKITPIQSGCCKPPSSCPYTYINETVMWTPTSGVSSKVIDIDCSRWSNDDQTLCFQCDSCKASVLVDHKAAWLELVLSLLTTLFLVLLIISCICCGIFSSDHV